MKLLINNVKSLVAKNAKAISVAVAAVGTSAAHAAGGTDVTAVTSAMTDAGVAIATVGSAYLVVIVGTKVFKWIARAM